MDPTRVIVSSELSPRWAGHLELTCSADAAGRSYLSHQSFRAPFHISKPYPDEHALIVQVINPTAGLFAGDVLRSDIRVEAGGRLHNTSPSASRVHRVTAGLAMGRVSNSPKSTGSSTYPGPAA